MDNMKELLTGNGQEFFNNEVYLSFRSNKESFISLFEIKDLAMIILSMPRYHLGKCEAVQSFFSERDLYWKSHAILG